jgi:hypothetical protein
MGMLQTLNATPVSYLPSLNTVFDNTMEKTRAQIGGQDVSNQFAAATKALPWIQSLGWLTAKKVDLPATPAAVADACNPAPLDAAYDSCESYEAEGAEGYPYNYSNASNEAAIDKALMFGPVVISTAFSGKEWGQMGEGHMILIEKVDPNHRGDYIVDDPGGNYFSAPTHHYFAGACGYRVDYPKSWVLAFTTKRYLLQLGPHVGAYMEGSAIQITDPGGPNSPSSFYLQDAQGNKTGFVNGVAMSNIPDSWAGSSEPWANDGADDPNDVSTAAMAASVASHTATTSGIQAATGPLSLTVADPQPGTTLHVVTGSSGSYELTDGAWQAGSLVSQNDLSGAAASGEDVVVSSPALVALVGSGSPSNSGQGNGNTTTTPSLASPLKTSVQTFLPTVLQGGGNAKVVASKTGRFTIPSTTAICGSGPCHLSVRVTMRSPQPRPAHNKKTGGPKMTLVASGTWTLASSQSSAITLVLSPAARRTLSASGQLVTTVTIVLTDSSGSSKTKTVTLRILPPPKPKGHR